MRVFIHCFSENKGEVKLLEEYLMKNTVTFSVATKQDGSRVHETFSFEELGIDEHMDEKEAEKLVERIFREWVWSIISFSYIISRPNK